MGATLHTAYLLLLGKTRGKSISDSSLVRMVVRLRALAVLPQSLGSISAPYGGLQTSITEVLGDITPSSDLHSHQAYP